MCVWVNPLPARHSNPKAVHSNTLLYNWSTLPHLLRKQRWENELKDTIAN